MSGRDISHICARVAGTFERQRADLRRLVESQDVLARIRQELAAAHIWLVTAQCGLTDHQGA